MTGKREVYLFDFNDSFTYNVASELYEIGYKAQVITPQNMGAKLQEIAMSRKKCVIVYGPGPGHPDEYSSLFPLILKALTNPYIYHFGVCLGHQLIWRARGWEVIPSGMPVHGQKFDFKVPSWDEFEANFRGREIPVQRYNSLVVKGNGEEFFALYKGEVMAARFERGISYQFHPESIGTANPKIFFAPIKQFLMESN